MTKSARRVTASRSLTSPPASAAASCASARPVCLQRGQSATACTLVWPADGGDALHEYSTTGSVCEGFSQASSPLPFFPLSTRAFFSPIPSAAFPLANLLPHSLSARLLLRPYQLHPHFITTLISPPPARLSPGLCIAYRSGEIKASL